MDRAGLSGFLRTHRERLKPSDTGLPDGARRRTPGLRREEVAALAGMSTDYYTRLEQRRGPQPSRATLDALARALRLSPDEHVHLFYLAGHGLPPGSEPETTVRPGLQLLLDKLDDHPALVLNGRTDILAWNSLAAAVFVDFGLFPAHQRNFMWLFFCLPASRQLIEPEEWQIRAETQVADLRVHVALYPQDQEFVTRLCAESPDFTELWHRHQVETCRGAPQRLGHPTVGTIELDCEMLLSSQDGQRLMLWTPRTGFKDKLDALRTQ